MSTALVPWQREYVARRQMFNFLGAAFRLYGPDGQLAFYVKQKAFRLKEEMVVFADEGQTKPMLRIRARSVLDLGATYDVTDASSGEKVGACRREALKSMLRDEWSLLGASDEAIGTLKEDSMLMALLRRFFLKVWLPQTFTIASTDGASLGQVKQRFNPFQLAYDVRLDGLDPRLGVAAVVLLLAIEGRQA
ncbi:MAG: hypothetical protein ACOZNI_16100 [Myxococcota bacterium]